MVRIPGIKQIEIKITDNKQIAGLEKEGWLVCGLKSINKDTIVVLEKFKDISPDVKS